ncbi:MAG TPA: ATP-binding cassette domain-containing protein [Aggregatilineaceae bacterium]|nr:ATP-binding cassette domain-containing protein [Aggregatilineaceae bacterium]
MSDPLYTLTDVQHIYGTRTVLRIPSLTIQPGEIFTLVGPSGAGKSTLLRLLALLEAPSRGQVSLCLNGRQVTYNSASTGDRRQLAMVFQRPALLSRNVRANVGYGLRVRGQQDRRAQIDAALKRVSLSHLAKARPRTLSGGEAQRVAVARALILEPQVLLLDEPTANLDPFNVRLIENLVREQHDLYGSTIVLVTHNIFQARRLATRIAFLLDGQLIETASAEAFFATPQDQRTAAFVSGELIY